MVDPAWWVSWYSPHRAFELHSPWWISGYSFDPPADVVVAAVRAPSVEAAWETIRLCYDDPPEIVIQRFCDPLDRDDPFSDRFPKADWHAWEPDGRTCNCSEHRVVVS